MLKAVIFDLDGTLINTLEDLTDAVNFGLGCAGMPKRSVEEVREFVGNGILKLLERSVYPITDSAVFEKVKKGFYEFYGAHGCDKTAPYEGIWVLLSALRSRGFLTAVVTNKDDAAAKQILRSLLGDSFTVIRGKTDEYPAKPAPDSTLSVMKELGVEPFECIFLGDSGVDIQTGVNSGAIAVGETWGFRDEAHLLKNGAKYIIHEPLELIKLIDSLNNQEGIMKREDYISWDQYFMGIAMLSAQRSKDPSTQVGACIVSDQNKILSVGYNGMPRCCHGNDEAFPWDREGKPLDTKYMYVCHAELNAILNYSGASLAGSRLYVTLFPCNECAKAIIQTGIRELIYADNKYDGTDSVEASKKMFEAAGVVYRHYEYAGKTIELNV